MPGKATVEGAKQIKERLRKATITAKNEVEQALVNSALMVERSAKIRAPVDTGRLRSSITHNLKGSGSDNPSAEIGTNTEYAPYVEHGTSRAAAKPFLHPAFLENKQKILNEIAKALRKGVGR